MHPTFHIHHTPHTTVKQLETIKYTCGLDMWCDSRANCSSRIDPCTGLSHRDGTLTVLAPWTGIVCQEDPSTKLFSVTQIHLPNQHLQCNLSALAFDTFENLTRVYVSRTSWSGLNSLSSIDCRDLQNNSFSGPFPSWVFSLQSLGYLYVIYFLYFFSIQLQRTFIEIWATINSRE